MSSSGTIAEAPPEGAPPPPPAPPHHSQCQWYHGPITRIAAELGVGGADGDFLVRDCISSSGDLVLTCRWGGQALHFRLNRVLSAAAGEQASSCHEPRLLYQFEDECFAGVSDLVEHHVRKAVPISALSGAVIRNPVFREVDGTPQLEITVTASAAREDEERMGQHQYGSLSEPPICPAESSSSPAGNELGVKEEVKKPQAPVRNTYFFGENDSGGGKGARDKPTRKEQQQQQQPLAFSSFRPNGVSCRPSQPDPSEDAALFGMTSQKMSSRQCQSMILDNALLLRESGQKGRRQEDQCSNSTLPRASASSFKPDPRKGSRMGSSEVVRVSWSSQSSQDFAPPPPLPALAPQSTNTLPPRPKGRPLPPPPKEEGGRKTKRTVPPPPLPERKSSATRGGASGTSNNKNGKSPLADPFPEDIKLPTTTVAPPPVEKEPPVPPKGNKSLPTYYDVPSVGKHPRSCLSERQEEGSTFYDQPRTLSKFKPFGRGAATAPPAPPSRSGSTSSANGAKKEEGGRPCAVVHLSYSARQNCAEGGGGGGGNVDCCASEVSNTDTSYLEHRELTPLLSSDNDSMVFDNNSLPGDPFPAGLPYNQGGNSNTLHNNSNSSNNNNNNNSGSCNNNISVGNKDAKQAGSQSTSASTSSSYNSQTSSFLDSSLPMESATAAKGTHGGEGENVAFSVRKGEEAKGLGLTYFPTGNKAERKKEEEEGTKNQSDQEEASHAGGNTTTGTEKNTCKDEAPTPLEGGDSDELSPVQSVFDLESYCGRAHSHFFPDVGADNKPLDPRAMAAVQALLLETPSSRLALHLLAQDVELLSIDLEGAGRYPGARDIRSGLHLLTLVEGGALREDVMERFLCLRLFALVTILGASSFGASVAALARWAAVARGCADLGDQLAMAAIVGALKNDHLRGLKGLWAEFEKQFPKEFEDLEGRLKPLLDSLNKPNLPLETDNVLKDEKDSSKEESPKVTVPYVIPFICGCKDLKDRKAFRMVFEEIFLSEEEEEKDVEVGERGQADEKEGKHVSFSKREPRRFGNVDPDSLPAFQHHLRRTHEALQGCADLREAAARALGDFRADADDVDSRASEAMRCQFHLRLLWGSRAARRGDPSDARHAKFSKVVRALAAICGSIEDSVLHVGQREN